MRIARLITIATAVGLTACGGNGSESDQNIAIDAPSVETVAPIEATILLADGTKAGTAKLAEDPTGVMIAVDVAGMPAGAHGLHLHTAGQCEAPDFESAGGHWNPTGAEHGRDNPAGAHAGDLANLVVQDDGKGASQFLLGGMKLRGGASPIIDSDGTSLIVHEKPDDYRTDPSGSSGARVACAVISG